MTLGTFLRRFTTAGLAAVVAVTMLGNVPASAAAAEQVKRQADKLVAGRNMSDKDLANRRTGKAYQPKAPVWPVGSAEAQVPAAGKAKVGDLPVQLGRPDKTGQDVAKAKVDVLDRAATAKAKVQGLLMQVSRADASTAGGKMKVSIDYSGFASAYGADWASRLRLVSLPPCALSTPDAPECAGTPIQTVNDTQAKTVTGDVELATTSTPMTNKSTKIAVVRSQALVAATAAPSGSSGNYGATSLQPSSTWSAGGNTGDFSWSYPMRVPPPPGGLAPQVALSYSSQSVDGRTAATNNQPSWIGEGFEYSPGFIERRYNACSKDMGSGANNTAKTGDLCWDTNNATMSLNGKSTELIFESGKGWHGRTDDGSRIELKTGGVNGDDNGEYWVVTTTSGTQYWFGKHQLPGWVSGKPVTNSTWTVPVAGNHSGEPGYVSGSFSSSFKTQAWRWNLDYVVDTHGNSMALWYNAETNKYAQNNTASNVQSYTRGGYLARIDYGTRSNTAYGTAPLQVVFNAADRCVTASCGTHDAANWPDTPWDQECTGSPCYVGSPTFWTTKRLSSVVTKLWTGTGTTYRDVETWTLHHSFPDPGDSTRAGLWLARIAHTGNVGTAVSLPDIKFTGVQMNNRVDNKVGQDFAPAMNWWRIAYVETETGGSINVSYSNQECVAGTNIPAEKHNNTKRCYPVRWTPEGHTDPVDDWFHKYVVTQVSESDMATAGTTKVTRYEYVGDPAWAYTDDDGLIEKANKTWSVWRGYGKVKTTVGEGAQAVTSETSFFRGMHGDPLPQGRRDIELPAIGDAPAVKDEQAFAGMVRESRALNGSDEVSAQVNEPWQSSPNASRTINGETVSARFTGTQATHSRTTLVLRPEPRRSTVRNTFDSYGMIVKVEDTGDEAVGNDQQCAITTYEPRNTTAWILAAPHRVQTYATDCGTVNAGGLTEDEVVSDLRTYYDSATTYGTAPTKGDVTKVETMKAWSNGTPSAWLTAASTVYDAYGRPTEVTDVKGNKTTTAYTHNTGGQLVSTKVTNALTWATTTTVEPAWGSTINVTDPNSRVTDLAYDGLGRLTSVWLPGRAKATQTASMTYAYLVRNNAPTVVTTNKLTPSATYVTTHALFDGLLRARQSQAPTAGSSGGARVITDTHYDSAGRAWKVNGPYATAGTVATDLFVPTSESSIDAQTVTQFDGAGRAVASVFQPKGVEKYRSATAYYGDWVDVTPPAGATATSTKTDARGKVVELRQYYGQRPAGDYDYTVYRYNQKGHQDQVTDPAGNKWTYKYDLMGRQIEASDPDKGVTKSTYNDAGELTSTTDARDKKLAYAYDVLGRKTALHDDSTAGAKRAEWTYDTLVKGQLTKSTRYDGANAYVNEVVGYNTNYTPTAAKITIPASETGLAGTYQYNYTYKADGSPFTTKFPAVGGTQTETLQATYNAVGLPNGVDTNLSPTTDYVSFILGTNYTAFGEVSQIGLSYNGSGSVQSLRFYEDDTRRLNRIMSTRALNPGSIADQRFSYDSAGNVLSQKDVKVGAEDTQCYRYDFLRRLTDAWTPGNADCAIAPDQAVLGGPAAYRTSWTFDKVGNRLTQTEHGTANGDRTTTYSHPAPGSAQPHTLTGTSTTDSTGTKAGSYTYDPSGNMLTRPGVATGQTMTWDAEGHLATNSENTSSYLYDADGNRLVSRDATGSTLFLPGQELRYTKATQAKVGTRYYSHAGQTVGMRVGATVTWLVGDHQGSTVASVNASTQAITRRYTTPYGLDRGTGVAWPNDKGLVGGTKDTTGLTHLGAREYDPATGRFISVDPVMDMADPQQWNAYTYSNASPITFSDPSGLKLDDMTTGEWNEELKSQGGKGACGCAPPPSTSDDYFDQLDDLYFGAPSNDGDARVILQGPKMPGNGIIVTQFFIQSKDAAGGILSGDVGGITLDPSAPYRIAMVWDTENGKISYTVTASCKESGGCKRQDPIREGGANFIKILGIKEPGADDKGSIEVRVGGLNSILPCCSVEENISIGIWGKNSSMPGISVSVIGDNYPSFQVTQYRKEVAPRLLAANLTETHGIYGYRALPLSDRREVHSFTHDGPIRLQFVTPTGPGMLK